MIYLRQRAALAARSGDTAKAMATAGHARHPPLASMTFTAELDNAQAAAVAKWFER